MTMPQTRKTYRTLIRASLTIGAFSDVLEHMTDMASLYIEDGLTQEGANLLTIVIKHPETPSYVMSQAEEHYDDLAAWICPRVLDDAQWYATHTRWDDIIESVLTDD